MEAGRSFDDVLDAALGTPRSAGRFPRIATAALMSEPLLAASGSGTSTWGLPPRPQRHAPRTPDEIVAFERLQAAGAGLLSSYSRDELRRAFHRLARELHPDRHPDLTASERATLGRRFAAVREDYLLLRRAMSWRSDAAVGRG
jgi:hypothetical protein